MKSHRKPHSTPDTSGMTHRGRVRSRNEDQFVLADLTRAMNVKTSSLVVEDSSQVSADVNAHLMLIADGMGGEPGGDAASRAAAGEASRYVLESLPCTSGASTADELQEELGRLVQNCEAAVRGSASNDPAHASMGTTLTLGYLKGEQLHVAHVGDSRCYLLRDGKLEQVTRDHTVAKRLEDKGVLDPRVAQGSQYANVLWNTLGGDEEAARPDIFTRDLKGVDAVLFCSDGLSGSVDDETIERILTRSERAEVACQALVDEANARGGKDNITAVVAFLTEEKAVQRQRGLPAEEAVRSLAQPHGSGRWLRRSLSILRNHPKRKRGTLEPTTDPARRSIATEAV